MKIKDFIDTVFNSARANYIYHFTASANLPTIKEHGIISKARQEEIRLQCPAPGGDTTSRFSDRSRGLYDYVSLSFTDNHPMAYICRNTNRQVNQVYLCIDLEVLKTPGVKVANGMANSKSSTIFDLEAGLDSLDLEVIYRQPAWSEDVKKRLNIARKYEILVPRSVPVHLIKRIKKEA